MNAAAEVTSALIGRSTMRPPPPETVDLGSSKHERFAVFLQYLPMHRGRLVRATMRYLESIAGVDRGWLALADSTGFSLPSVGY